MDEVNRVEVNSRAPERPCAGTLTEEQIQFAAVLGQYFADKWLVERHGQATPTPPGVKLT